MLTIQDILDILNQQALTRWIDLIAEGIAGLARDLGARTIPVPDAVEWLAEWPREVREGQRDLLLLTAHRAKGLEFDHVVILNGGRATLSKEEDDEAPRRLFYVAMTRARRTLAVVTSGAHTFVHADSESELLRRIPPPRHVDLPEPDQYQLPDMGAVDLSFAGRAGASSPTLKAIAESKVGDPVTLESRDGRWFFLDAKGRTLGRMAAKWAPPPGTRLVTGQIGAIFRWRKADNEEAWQSTIQREDWETVLPELVFRRLSDF